MYKTFQISKWMYIFSCFFLIYVASFSFLLVHISCQAYNRDCILEYVSYFKVVSESLKFFQSSAYILLLRIRCNLSMLVFFFYLNIRVLSSIYCCAHTWCEEFLIEAYVRLSTHISHMLLSSHMACGILSRGLVWFI